jgi:hypothetical protein
MKTAATTRTDTNKNVRELSLIKQLGQKISPKIRPARITARKWFDRLFPL